MRKMSTPAKLLMSVGALGAAAAIAGLGTYATFTSTTSASNTVTAGKVSIALGSPSSGSLLSVSATNVVPGDTINRVVDLVDSSTDPLATVELTTTATSSSILDTDTSTGLQTAIQTCTQAWTVTGTAPAQSYSCGATGGAKTVLSTANIIMSNVSLSNLTALTTGGSTTDHLLITETLPSANTVANLSTPPSSTIQYSFTGTQRAGTLR